LIDSDEMKFIKTELTYEEAYYRLVSKYAQESSKFYESKQKIRGLNRTIEALLGLINLPSEDARYIHWVLRSGLELFEDSSIKRVIPTLSVIMPGVEGYEKYFSFFITKGAHREKGKRKSKQNLRK
jgi:hypothetical protein